MVSIGRINIGRKEKRAFFSFPLNHDVETTSTSDFVSRHLSRQFIKGSKINLQTKDICSSFCSSLSYVWTFRVQTTYCICPL